MGTFPLHQAFAGPFGVAAILRYAVSPRCGEGPIARVAGGREAGVRAPSLTPGRSARRRSLLPGATVGQPPGAGGKGGNGPGRGGVLHQASAGPFGDDASPSLVCFPALRGGVFARVAGGRGRGDVVDRCISFKRLCSATVVTGLIAILLLSEKCGTLTKALDNRAWDLIGKASILWIAVPSIARECTCFRGGPYRSRPTLQRRA